MSQKLAVLGAVVMETLKSLGLGGGWMVTWTKLGLSESDLAMNVGAR